jgi:serine O-acetyltransferase
VSDSLLASCTRAACAGYQLEAYLATLATLVKRGSGLVRTLRQDIRAKAQWMYQDTSTVSLAKALLTDGTASVVLYRLMQASRHAGLAPLEMVFNKLNGVIGGCVIGRGAEFGPGLVLIHSQGVFINGAVRAGANVHIEHQVTIGAEKDQSPVLGSEIFIGCGAKVVGSVTIGDGARIGANAVVLHDVPPATTVVGIPAKPVVRRKRSPRPTTDDLPSSST